MNTANDSKLELYLQRFSESDWESALDSLSNSIHPVDRNATAIWFRFHPTALFKYFSDAEDTTEAAKGVALQGEFGLDEKIDSSHEFLYGHRYWRSVKSVIEQEVRTFEKPSVGLAGEISRIATKAAAEAKCDVALIVGITAVGMATLAQVGAEAFSSAPGNVTKSSGIMSKSPDAIVRSRAADDSQGMLGFLKTINKKFSVIYDETRNGKFDIMNDQEIASASANDRSQNWQEKDERCWEGPVPVECTSASCGTCWVGVLGGADKLSEVSRREARAMKVFGYVNSDEQKPIIRLACQARAAGNVTLVIPPWNAVFGKKVYGNVEELELEPVTTSAKALRAVVKETTSSSETK